MAAGIHDVLSDAERAEEKPVNGLDTHLPSPLGPAFSLSPGNALSSHSPVDACNGSAPAEDTHGFNSKSNGNNFYSTTPDFKLSDSCIDDDRPMKVVVIGAGFSGIIAGIRFANSFLFVGQPLYLVCLDFLNA